MENQEEQGVGEGVDERHVERHLVGHGLLGVYPLPAPVEESHQEERSPEDEIGNGDDEEHLDPGHALLLHPLDVGSDPVRRWQASLLERRVSSSIVIITTRINIIVIIVIIIIIILIVIIVIIVILIVIIVIIIVITIVILIIVIMLMLELSRGGE